MKTAFNKSLPHLATISKWHNMSVDGKPGFTKEVLVALNRRDKTNKTLLCNWVMDEMTIKETK